MKRKIAIKRTKSKPRTKRPSKLESLIIATMQDYAHMSTNDITRFRIVLACQFNTVGNQIEDLIRQLKEAKTEQTRVGTIMTGLNQVIQKR